MTNTKKLFAALATAALVFPTLTGAQVFDDHTKIRILRGAPSQIDAPFNCPAGSVYSGGECTLISNQAASFMCGSTQVMRGMQNGAPVCVDQAGGGGGGGWKYCGNDGGNLIYVNENLPCPTPSTGM
jgi:hypothetical protein